MFLQAWPDAAGIIQSLILETSQTNNPVSNGGFFCYQRLNHHKHPFWINNPFQPVLSSSIELHLNGCRPMVLATATPPVGQA